MIQLQTPQKISGWFIQQKLNQIWLGFSSGNFTCRIVADVYYPENIDLEMSYQIMNHNQLFVVVGK